MHPYPLAEIPTMDRQINAGSTTREPYQRRTFRNISTRIPFWTNSTKESRPTEQKPSRPPLAACSRPPRDAHLVHVLLREGHDDSAWQVHTYMQWKPRPEVNLNKCAVHVHGPQSMGMSCLGHNRRAWAAMPGWARATQQCLQHNMVQCGTVQLKEIGLSLSLG